VPPLAGALAVIVGVLLSGLVQYWPRISYANDLAELMRSGIVDQSSFAFRIGAEQMTTTMDENDFETDHFRILIVSDLFDVCVTPQGAYDQTDAVMHARFAATGRAVDSAGRPIRIPDPDNPGGSEDSSRSEPSESAGDENAAVRKRRLELLRLKTRQHFPETKEPQ